MAKTRKKTGKRGRNVYTPLVQRKMYLGEHLARLRPKMTQADLARALSVAPATISEIVSSGNPPSTAMTLDISYITGIPVDDLFKQPPPQSEFDRIDELTPEQRLAIARLFEGRKK